MNGERNELGVKDETLMIPLGKLGHCSSRGMGTDRKKMHAGLGNTIN